MQVGRGRSFGAQPQGVVRRKVPLLAVAAPAVVAPEVQRSEAGLDGAREVLALDQVVLAGGTLTSRGIDLGLSGSLSDQAQGFLNTKSHLLFDMSEILLRVLGNELETRLHILEPALDFAGGQMALRNRLGLSSGCGLERALSHDVMGELLGLSLGLAPSAAHFSVARSPLLLKVAWVRLTGV